MLFCKYNEASKMMVCDVYLDDDYQYNYTFNKKLEMHLPLIHWHSAIPLSKGEICFVAKALYGLIKVMPDYSDDDLVGLLDQLSDIIINDVEGLIARREADVNRMSPEQILDIVTQPDIPSPQDIVDDITDEVVQSDKSEAIKQIKQSYHDETPDHETGVPQGILNELKDILG